jgi:hypothetical protein
MGDRQGFASLLNTLGGEVLRVGAREQHVAKGLRGRRCRLVLLLRASQAVGSGKSQRDGLRSRCVLVVGQVSHPELTGADRHGVRTARSTLNRVPRSSAFARAFKRRPDAVGCTCICTCAPCGMLSGGHDCPAGLVHSGEARTTHTPGWPITLRSHEHTHSNH